MSAYKEVQNRKKQSARKAGKTATFVLSTLLVVLGAFLMLFPYFYMIVTALKTPQEMLSSSILKGFWPKDPQWTNFIDVFRGNAKYTRDQFNFLNAMKNTMIIEILVIPIGTLLFFSRRFRLCENALQRKKGHSDHLAFFHDDSLCRRHASAIPGIHESEFSQHPVAVDSAGIFRKYRHDALSDHFDEAFDSRLPDRREPRGRIGLVPNLLQSRPAALQAGSDRSGALLVRRHLERFLRSVHLSDGSESENGANRVDDPELDRLASLHRYSFPDGFRVHEFVTDHSPVYDHEQVLRSDQRQRRHQGVNTMKKNRLIAALWIALVCLIVLAMIAYIVYADRFA